MSDKDSIAIVGTALVGRLSALGLAQPGIRISVIERGKDVGVSRRVIPNHWSVLGVAARGDADEVALDRFAEDRRRIFLDNVSPAGT